jgi:glycosyltransferase involved in cell wall biosynthesis
MVVIPAHNEADDLPSAVTAVLGAATCVSIPVTLIVVLDSCDDGSAALAGQFGPDVHFVTIDARSVGAARAAGFSYARALSEKVGTGESRLWYATTDADSVVDPDWLLRQIGADADVVLGVVRISTWYGFSALAARRYLAAYRSKIHPEGHGHVHWANMGFRADWYWQVGGFAALASDEDVDLVACFESAGVRIARDAQLSV